MKKFTIEDIKGFQYHMDELEAITNSICLVEFDPNLINERTFTIHTNFIMVEILIALRNSYIDGTLANFLLNKVDALYDSTDMLSRETIIKKFNSEIVEDMLGVPYFNKLAVICKEYFNQY